jgi:hypothetical protein
LIKLAIELHDLSVRIAVIDKNVVSDDVTARPSSVMMILLGAELDGEMEHQTPCDTMSGAPKPIGWGAKMADTVGQARPKQDAPDR